MHDFLTQITFLFQSVKQHERSNWSFVFNNPDFCALDTDVRFKPRTIWNLRPIWNLQGYTKRTQECPRKASRENKDRFDKQSRENKDRFDKLTNDLVSVNSRLGNIEKWAGFPPTLWSFIQASFFKLTGITSISSKDSFYETVGNAKSEVVFETTNISKIDWQKWKNLVSNLSPKRNDTIHHENFQCIFFLFWYQNPNIFYKYDAEGLWWHKRNICWTTWSNNNRFKFLRFSWICMSNSTKLI